MGDTVVASRSEHASAAPESSRRKPLTWIPGVAALVTFLVGLSDVLAVFKPDWHERLHKFSAVVPGTLTNVTRTSDVIVGLLLLMLSRGLRRRKRSAWQAAIVLLVLDIAFHFEHFPRVVMPSGFVAIVLVAVLLWRRADFYAVGDPRSRRTVVPVFLGLVVLDFAICLGYLAVGPLAGSYSFGQRLQDVLYELVGVYGPVAWAVDARGDFYHLLTSALGIAHRVVPMTDGSLRTLIETDTGTMDFQRWFVGEQCRPVVRAIRFAGAGAAPSPGFAEALARPDLAAVVLCPSNPFLSVDPILSLDRVRDAVLALTVPRVAVSPLIGGKSVKGPLGKLLGERGQGEGNAAIASHYGRLIDHWLIDRRDEADAQGLRERGLCVTLADTLMHSSADRERLAREVLTAAGLNTDSNDAIG